MLKCFLAGIIDRSGNNAFINKAKGLPQALATDRTAYSLQRMVGNLDSVKRNDDSIGVFNAVPAPNGENYWEQDNENVKYSLTKLDEDYLRAVKSGDLETAQKLVDEAAKAAGIPILDDSASEGLQSEKDCASENDYQSV